MSDQQDTLIYDIARDALVAGEFSLKSGQQSDIYVDKWRLVTDPPMLRALAERLAPLVDPDADLLAAPVLGAVPLAAAVSLIVGKPFLIVRDGPKDHGTAFAVEGAYRPGLTVTLIEDVLTTGATAFRTLMTLADHGLWVSRIIALVDREQGARAILEKPSRPLRALYTLDQLCAARAATDGGPK